MSKTHKISNGVYLDYAATTPVDKRVVKAMLPFLSESFGNTMSLHSFGQEAKLALEQSRQILADVINAEPNEIVFTSSATESNNLALKGVALVNRKKGNHIIISSIEHPCIMESARWLEKNGFSAQGGPASGWEITKLPVDKYGLVNPEDVKKAIKKNTILVSVIHASNEIGTIEPIEKIGKICRDAGVYFHTDASQSFGKTPIDVEKMNIDLLTASSHKIYGPKGAGLLYIREGINLEPILHGGGQENGLRGSTVNVPAIVGFAKAAEICQKEMVMESKRQIKLRDNLIKKVLKINPVRNGVSNGVKGAHLTGHPTKRLPNIASFWFEFVEGESLIMRLDLDGIACSTGSACSSFKLEPSEVLMACGLRPEQAHGSLRVSLGRFTTEKDINYLIKVLPGIIKKIREISPYGKK
jgi:cysteine desulfurase